MKFTIPNTMITGELYVVHYKETVMDTNNDAVWVSQRVKLDKGQFEHVYVQQTRRVTEMQLKVPDLEIEEQAFARCHPDHDHFNKEMGRKTAMRKILDNLNKVHGSDYLTKHERKYLWSLVLPKKVTL